MRKAIVDRRTAETQIRIALSLDGKGRFQNNTGIRFLDHMLDLVARHGAFDLKVKATGDLDVDQHHTVEDVGIALGEAVLAAIGNKRGINRAGYFVMPMDETLAVAAIDLSGRPHSVIDTKVSVRVVGDLQTELVHDFFEGFASAARAKPLTPPPRPDRNQAYPCASEGANRSPHKTDAGQGSETLTSANRLDP